MSSHTSNEVRRFMAEKCTHYKDYPMLASTNAAYHETRDFTRTPLLRLPDHVEKHDNFIEFFEDMSCWIWTYLRIW